MKHTPLGVGRGPRPEGCKEKFWRKALATFAASGQSVRAFCATRRLAEPSFYSWRRTLAERDATAHQGVVPTSAGSPAAAPAFVPVHLADPRKEMGGLIEVVLAGGRRIRVRGPVDRALLAEVVAALEDGVPASEAGR